MKSDNWRFDLGNKRPDGRQNVWTMKDVRGWPEWVIVHVAPSREHALQWIFDGAENTKTPQALAIEAQAKIDGPAITAYMREHNPLIRALHEV